MKKLPFFSRSLQAVVVDEMCKCGHMKSEHASKVVKVSNSLLRLSNQGGLSSDCPRFTWDGYVTAEEKAEMLLAQRPACAGRKRVAPKEEAA